MRLLKPLAVTLLLIIWMSSPALAQPSFFVPKYLRTYLVLHLLPILGLLISLIWGRKHSAARVIVYGLCGIAAILGLLIILIHLFLNEEGLFPLLTLTALSIGVIIMTDKRKARPPEEPKF